MASMTCKEKILSEDYMDLINYFILPEGSVQGNDDVFCYIPINERFLSIYYSRAVLPPLEVSSYFYRYIPRLYGLMDLFVPEALDRNFLRTEGAAESDGQECCPWICGYGNRLPESCFQTGGRKHKNIGHLGPKCADRHTSGWPYLWK